MHWNSEKDLEYHFIWLKMYKHKILYTNTALILYALKYEGLMSIYIDL